MVRPGIKKKAVSRRSIARSAILAPLPGLRIAIALGLFSLGACAQQPSTGSAEDGPPFRSSRLGASAPAALRPSPGEAPGLVGQPSAQVVRTLGPAAFVRRDGAAEIWRYAGDDCFLDLFLFRDGGESKVAYVEARPRGEKRVSAAVCFEHLRVRAPSPVGGQSS